VGSIESFLVAEDENDKDVSPSLKKERAQRINYYRSTFAYNYQPNTVQLELSHLCSFFVFFGAILYVCTFLPFGRFYNRVGGNVTMLYAYLYIFVYLSVPEIKKIITPLYIQGLKSKAIFNLFKKQNNEPFGSYQ
jgi:hypothetical protein